MSKLSFRARHLDPSKQMPIYLAEELPDLPEYSAINRAVPQMPSGMEKEEESEHHLQRAICTGLIIPTPEVLQTDQPFYDAYYPPDYKMPRQMIHMQPLGLDTEVPDYDMDSADEEWLSQQQRLELTELKFEQMMDKLEKSSGQTVVTLNEAKSLLNQDDETSISVYDYWLNKRLKMQHPLILTVKTESRPGASSNNPYLAFRRRTEKMQTRKNRKNDEASYEKMLKLRRDLQRATTILEMVRQREETKRDHLKMTVDIFEKRVEMRDFNGAVYSELYAQIKNSRPAYNPLYTNQYSQVTAGALTPGTLLTTSIFPGILSAGAVGATASAGIYAPASQYLNTSSMEAINAGGGLGLGNNSSRKEKRPYKKRKHKIPREKQHQQQQQQQYLPGIGLVPPAAGVAHPHLSHLHLHRQSASPAANESNVETEEDDFINGGPTNGNKVGSESEDEAPFAFRRKQSCSYLRMRQKDGHWPWESPHETSGVAHPKYRYALTSINYPRPRCIGFARRRLGRGGRVLFDRATTNFDDFLSQLDYTVLESVVSTKPAAKEIVKPSSPPTVVDLPVAKTQDTPAPTIKVEHTDDTNTALKAHNYQQQANDDINGEDEFDNDDEDDELGTDDENISRISAYSSALTLQQSPHDLRMKRRRIRRMKQKLRELNAAKRLKSLDLTGCMCNGIEDESKKTMLDSSLNPLPKAYLKHLAMKLSSWQTTALLESASYEEEPQLEQQVGDENANAASENLEVKQQAQPQDELQSDQSEQLARANNQHHRSKNNTVLNNNSNNNNISSSCSNMNKNVSISEKFNVIKVEEDEHEPVASTSAAAAAARAAEAAAAASAVIVAAPTPTIGSTVVTSTTVGDLDAKTIKCELIDADDSNEPLSSIRTAAVAMQQDIIDDEEDDVNLAQLSNIIRHTVKKELETKQQRISQSESGEQQLLTNIKQELTAHTRAEEEDQLSGQPVDSNAPCLNQMPDVIRLRNLRNRNVRQTPTTEKSLYVNAEPVDVDDDTDYMGGLSPTSSQRLDICNELLSEIRRDWLHFRPKTPTDELSDSNEAKTCEPSDAALVDWTQDTPISVELNRLDCIEDRLKPDPATSSDDDNRYFMSSAFKYTDLESDTQLLQMAYGLDYARGSSKSPDNGNSNSVLDLNLSGGDSLTDINLLGDGDDTDENILDNILQECGMDDPKTLNQATRFWNGILDGEEAVDDEANEEESADDLLECMDDKVKAKSVDTKRNVRHRGGKSRIFNKSLGSSSFSVSATPNAVREKLLFFSQQTPKAEPEWPASIATIKAELPEAATESAPPPQQPQQSQPAQPQQLLVTVPSASAAISTVPQVLNIPAQIPQQQQQQQLPKTPAQVTQIVNQAFTGVAQQAQLISRAALQTTEFVTTAPTAAVGDIVTITPHTGSSLMQQQQQSLLQPTLPTLTQQQQQLQHQLQQAQLRNVTVQQRQAQASPQQHQQQQQQQQQQLLFQIQRDIANAPVITQYVSSGTAAVTSQSIVSSGGNMRSAANALTPLNAGAGGNHMIYTTTTGELVTASTAAGTGTQKVTYAIQKASGGNAPTQVPGTIGPNTVITLSNVKLQHDGQTPNANMLTIDGGVATSGAGSNAAPSVNIINTASGQQVAVHSIAGMQQLPAGVASSSASTPLIVTTPPRNNTQQQQQQPIVWRQVSGTNTAVATTAVLSTTAESPAAVGNKILWTSRGAGQKRQMNGPENTDINKLLLNRKFSQRKLVAQAAQQPMTQQIQLTKQQLQQLVQQEDEIVINATGNNDHLTLQESTPGGAGEQQQIQQLQKLNRVIKMSPYPLHVSDLNLQQQQSPQTKSNSSATIATNHNYSLQPAAVITSQAAPQQANKIYLTSSNSAGTGNFTIATASELQAAASGLAAAAAQGGQSNTNATSQKLQNSNLKVNFVTTSSSPGGVGVDNVVSQTPQTQQVGATTVVLNKGSGLPTSIQQQQQQQHQKLKTVAASNTSVATSQQGEKRVVYTSLLNVKPLQKNNTGQMQMQIGPGGLQQVLRGRLNNSAIFTRTLPIGTTVNSTGSGSAGAGGGAANAVQVQFGTPTTIRQLVSANSNNVTGPDGTAGGVAGSGGGGPGAGDTLLSTPTVLTASAKEMNKTLTVEQVIASANNGGVVLPSSNNNNNGSGVAVSGTGSVGGVTVTTSAVNASAVTPTINR